jgi:formylglycine-generating enzyme required for sulfatase activity
MLRFAVCLAVLPLAGAGAQKPVRKAAKPAAPQIELVPIPAGSFAMGSRIDADEQPVHRVTFSRAISMGKYEVTQPQWTAVMGKNPSQFTGAALPVERVTWDEATEFCKRMTAMTGTTYRLPTEAEWEYACRAGSTGLWSFGDDERALQRFAWYDENARQTTHAVGTRKPNAWGLCDMHGNVWEWCSDWYAATAYAGGDATDPTGPPAGEARVMRGGSYGAVAPACRAANRFYTASDQRLFATGLRVVVEEK